MTRQPALRPDGKKTLLIICGGIEAVHGIRLAREMGLHVVVSDMNPDAPGMREADDRIVASTYDVEATVAAATAFHETVRPIDGVTCIGADVPLTVASVAQALGLAGIPVEAAQLAMDKLAMKERFAAHGVPIPRFSLVKSADELEEMRAQRRGLLVIKPVDSRGSRGVVRLEDDVDSRWAFENARGFSPTGRAMVEHYLDGPQVSTESLMLNGKCYTPGFSDRNYELLARYRPHFIENGGDLPSHLPRDIQRAVSDVVGAAARALGIDNGNVKGDIVVHDGKPHVIELAARLSGGYFCTREIPLNTGVDFVGQVFRQALGETIDPQDLVPRYLKPVAQRYKFPEPGRVTAIAGLEEARAIPGIAEVLVSVREGDMLPIPTDSNASAAMVLATAESREEAIARAEAAIARIQIETVAP